RVGNFDERQWGISVSAVRIRRDARRAVAWVLTFNATYWLFLVTPCLVIRFLFGDPSSMVP
ncbi:hypothetical protein, partial [Mycolicibacterium phlei]